MSKNSDDLTPLALNEQKESFRSEPVKTTQHDSSKPSKENEVADKIWRGEE
jgi:hypothetical protein